MHGMSVANGAACDRETFNQTFIQVFKRPRITKVQHEFGNQR